MNETATRERCADAPTPALWQHVPLDFALAALAVFVAAGLKRRGVMG